MEMRCGHKLHGIIVDDAVEVKCGSALCGSKPGVVVIHRFSRATGELLSTMQYKDTPIIKKERTDGQRTSVRSP